MKTKSTGEFTSPDHRIVRLAERYSIYLDSPVARLKFLDGAMRIRRRGLAKRLPIACFLGTRMRVALELAKVLPAGSPMPSAIRMTMLLYRLRIVAYAASAAAALAVTVGAVSLGSRIVADLTVPSKAMGGVAVQNGGPASTQAGERVAVIGSKAGLSLDRVWLAEQGPGYEFYSNGARVLTQYETEGPDRRFYRFALDQPPEPGRGPELLSRPVGIVYHLSESDLLPFAGNNNSSLQRRSKSLLEYARDHRLYNYVIDRFGRTYRIVRDEMVSSHAGNSVWSDGKSLYINLSMSFIGVCFEGRSTTGNALGQDGINEAQIYAARVLTAVLRSRHGIDDADCVTHGLVSMNPSRRLMGYHTDWVFGFPYEALGLTDKHKTEMFAVSRLGFGYDGAYIAAAGGERWLGLEMADKALERAAREGGKSVDEARGSAWRGFQAAYSMQRELERAPEVVGEGLPRLGD